MREPASFTPHAMAYGRMGRALRYIPRGSEVAPALNVAPSPVVRTLVVPIMPIRLSRCSVLFTRFAGSGRKLPSGQQGLPFTNTDQRSAFSYPPCAPVVPATIAPIAASLRSVVVCVCHRGRFPRTAFNRAAKFTILAGLSGPPLHRPQAA